MSQSIRENKGAATAPGLFALLPAIILLQLLDALCFPVTRFGIQQVEPFTFAFFRFTISSVILLAIVRLMKPEKQIARSDWWKIGLLAVIIIPGNQLMYMFGQSMTAAGHGAFLFATAPVWIFVLALIHLKEKVTWQKVLGIVLSFGGVLVIMLGGRVYFGTEYVWGDAVILIAVLAWSYYTIIGKPLVEKYGALRITAYALATGSALYFPYGLYCAITFDYSAVTAGAWGAVVYMALGMSVALYVLWYWVLKYMDASRLAIWHNLFPVVSVIVAYFLLGEPLTTSFVVGGMAVLAGVTITEV
ncbi:MAG: DMT family transporter [Candidatus Zixiibacteriota bacterium]|nr:MAG: DMT family transporter [candidate division Zixibacteria bacterium]